MITRFFRRTAVAALCLGLLAALLVLTSGQAQTGWQWYTVDLHSHSAVSADAFVDLGIIAENAKSGGYDAVFVTDHGGASTFQINGMNANRTAFEDTYTRWDIGTYGVLTTIVNELVATPIESGAASLHLKSTSSGYGETFVYTGRGPNLRAGDATITVSIYPTQIDAGSGVYVSAAVGGDPSILSTPWGYTTAAGVVSPGKSVVFVWQLGTPRGDSIDPDALVQTYDLGPYTLDQWNTYTINISQVIEQYFESHPADRPLDYNGLVHLKMAAGASAGGTAEAYFDSYTIQDPTPPAPADEFAYRNDASRISAFNTADFKLFAGGELGQTRHTQRFNFGFTDPSQFVFYDLGKDGIPLIHQLGYPAQLNHPGSTITVSETVQNNAYNADFVETRAIEHRDAWDQMLTNGYLILGHWTTDSHTGGLSGGRPATIVYAPALELDPLMQSTFEGRSYSAMSNFGGQIVYNRDAASTEPYPARYPVYVSSAATSADVHLKVTGGLSPSDMVRWVQNNATLASQAAGGSSFDTVQAIPLPGEFTYARAEVLRASGSPRGITQPIFFRDVAGLPADMSFSVDRTTTTDSIHYNRDDIQGIASATWDETNSSLALTLTNPSGSLVELRLAAGLSTPAALDNDGQSIAASGTLEGYQSSPDSAWFFDAAQGVLYFKVRHAANSAQVQVGFGTGSATPTPTAGPIILAPAADAYVDSARAGANYGSSVSLRTDALPEQRSYLRFAVPGDAGPITGATLRVYANTASVTGYRASRTEGGWTENDINYNNKPATIGTPVGTSGSVASNTWTQVNVLDALLAAGGSGELNLMLDTTSSTAVRYDSREGPNAPQLVIQSTGQNTPEPPTATPTPEAAATLTFAPVEDAYVSDSAPDARYGAAANLRVDTTAPVQRSYLRFDVQGIVGTVTRATLRVFAASGSSQGYEVRTLSGSWSEAAVAYNTALGIGASAAGVSNKPITTGSWTAVDVTSLVAGNGLLDLALTGISSTAINFNSREGANPPQLVVEFGGSGRTSETAHEASPLAFSLPPDSLDSDGDGAPDAVELLSDSNPAMFDTDGDSLLDLWEIESGLSPADAEDRDGAQGDPDGDGISNLEEQRNGTDPLNPGDRSALPLFLPFVLND